MYANFSAINHRERESRVFWKVVKVHYLRGNVLCFSNIRKNNSKTLNMRLRGTIVAAVHTAWNSMIFLGIKIPKIIWLWYVIWNFRSNKLKSWIWISRHFMSLFTNNFSAVNPFKMRANFRIKSFLYSVWHFKEKNGSKIRENITVCSQWPENRKIVDLTKERKDERKWS